VSAKYRFAAKDTPPARALNARFPGAPLEANLVSVITDGSPGSWKREAFWDEYVATLHNGGDQPLQVASATLVDSAGTPRSPGDDPWALERESKTLERKYRDSGMAFARIAGPRVLAATAEPVVIASAGIGAAHKQAQRASDQDGVLPPSTASAAEPRARGDSDRKSVLPDGSESRLDGPDLVNRGGHG
jgi:hypothetical protein